MEAKICGVKDLETLEFITTHTNAPEFIGFICNYKKSKRFIKLADLKKILKVKKRKSNYVAVLVKPTLSEISQITKLPFDYYQIYDLPPKEIIKIKEKNKVKIIVAITVKEKNDVLAYKKYINVADIILFDSKGYEKSIPFNHHLINNIKLKTRVMLAGDIQINDNFNNYKKITNILDISGGLETSGLKDISKISIFLEKIKQIND